MPGYKQQFSEERYKSVIKLSNTGVWEYHSDTGYLFCSPEYFEMLGMDIKDFPMDGKPNLKETWIDLLHPEDRDHAASKFADYLKEGSPGMYESFFRMKHSNGNWLWNWSRGKTLRETDGSTSELTVGTHINITDRRLAEEALLDTEGKLKALFDSMTEIVVIHDVVFDENRNPVNYRITDVNKAFSDNFGITHEAAVGKLATEVYQVSTPPYLAEFSDVAINGKPFYFETWFPPMKKHFSISVVSLGANRFATVTTDVTNIKEAEQIIAAKNKELEQIVYVASHDLRSPLVNVEGYSQELEFVFNDFKKAISGFRDQPEMILQELDAMLYEAADSLNHIRISVRQMDALLKGLLTLSRIGRAALRFEKINMAVIMQKLLVSMEYQLQQAEADVSVSVLPSCWSDTVQVSQIFSNLVGNAIKYAHPDRKPVIKISGSVVNGKSVYIVEDNGIGIEKHHQEIIFELFHRLDPTEKDGDGLGLTIVKQILSRLEGTIDLESEPGKGSRFIVSLPATSH